MTLPAKDKKFDPGFAITTQDGRTTALFRDYLAMVDRLLTQMQAGYAPTLVNAANDGAAAAAGVAIGQFYRNGSVVQVRVA